MCNVQHISLTKDGLSLQLQVGVVDDGTFTFEDAVLVIGERARQPFDIPVSKKTLAGVKDDDPFFIRKFHISMDELTRAMEETSSRCDIALKVNGMDVTFPVKIEVPDENIKYQHVPMISFFYKNDAVQIKHTGVGNVLFVCRPLEEVEKTASFRFWESDAVSGRLYRKGKEEKKKSSLKVLSLIHISEPTRRVVISYAVFCLKKIFFNDTATTEIYTRLFVGSVRCV